MIQELLGGSSGLLGESKISINRGVLQVPPSVPSSTISPTTSTPTASSDQSQNLRCPRCDSSNTKFCYYNNYNLTQPRHFCKTCRRYWTKGGALRNVPIGGGCRKNRNITTPTTAGGKCVGPGKAKIMTLPEIEKASWFGGPGFDPSSAILWTSAPQGSHLLALLRAPQNPNPNPNPDPMVSLPLCGSTVVSPVGLDPSSWRNNQQQQQNGFTLVEPSHNSGIQGMYQKIRSSSNYFQPHASVAHATSLLTSNAMPVVESVSVAGLGGEPGFWNPALSWPGLPSTNGAYP